MAEAKKMEQKNMTALDVYISKVYKITLLSITLTCLLGGLSSTMDRLSGFYENISLGVFIFCDLTNVLYVLIAVYLFKSGVNYEFGDYGFTAGILGDRRGCFSAGKG